MNDLEDILIWIGFFAMVVVIIWIRYKLSVRNREMINKERMALIEKGVYDFPKEYEIKSGINLHKYLFWGFVVPGLGIALIIAPIITKIYVQDVVASIGLMIGGLIFLFPGLGILLFYLIQSKKEKKEKEKISTNSKVKNISE